MKSDENTKEKIIEVAIECFGEHGYDAASMRMIAEKSGVSKPAIYYYFPDKEHLFKGIFKYVMMKFNAMLESIEKSDKDVISKLKEIVLSRSNPFMNKTNIKRFASRMFVNGGKHLSGLDHRAFFVSQEKILLNIIQQGIDDGTFRSDINKKFLLYTILGSSNLFTRDHVLNHNPLLTEQDVDELIQQILEGVAAKSKINQE